ncbi:MAG: response regulator [Magnetococcales bacterium]|nr:response regulator [Magnetococcales bacterium]
MSDNAAIQVLPSPLRLLVVEDVAYDFQLLLRFLRKEGLEVVAERVETGAEMRTRLAEQTWDAVLADANLPVFSAKEALLICQEMAIQVPFIVISGAIAEEKAADLIKSGANDFVTKQNLFRLITAMEREFKAMEEHRRHRLAQQALKESEEQFRSVAESAGDAIITVNQYGCITFWNRGAQNLFGYTAEEVIGQPVTILMPVRYQEAHIQGMQTLKATGHSRMAGKVVELAGVRKDGCEFPIEITLSSWEARGSRYFSAVIRDVTERQQIMFSLQEALKAAQVANSAKSEFLSNMSHEIRTPMNVVLGMSELLLETNLNPEQRRYTTIMHHSGKALLRVINDVLDFSRIEADRISLAEMPFSPRQVLEESASLMQIVAQEKGITLEWRVTSAIPEAILGDDGRVRQVLINLLGNAIKFTHQGRVVVELAIDSTQSDSLLYRVEDTGIGIHPEQMEYIFQHFTQADAGIARRYGGTGLGLAISRRLVELMGGRIWVESRLGEGSKFFFTLPARVVAASVCPDVEEGRRALPQTRSLHILLAEDVEENRILFDAYLAQTPHDLVMVNDGLEAVARVQEQIFDVVVMDVQMPIMDGYTATRQIRQWEREMQRSPMMIVALSAHAMEGEQMRSKEAGCDLYLTKPINKKKLLEVLNRIASQLPSDMTALSATKFLRRQATQ